jgi:hypothetical protein
MAKARPLLRKYAYSNRRKALVCIGLKHDGSSNKTHASFWHHSCFYFVNFKNMADNKNHVGKPDRDRINLSEDYEVNAWSKKFGVSREELKNAVKQVGSVAKDVEAYLNKGKK